MIKTRNQGFTLIELLVVIAIIGLLSTIVVASLSTVRKKARDAKRVADTKSLELAMEVFFDTNRRYPDATEVGTGGTVPLVPTYISALAKDPLGSNYKYVACGTAGAASGFHLGASLEDVANQALGTDSDFYNTTTCAADFRGLSTNAPSTVSTDYACSSAADGVAYGSPGATETCYDIKR